MTSIYNKNGVAAYRENGGIIVEVSLKDPKYINFSATVKGKKPQDITFYRDGKPINNPYSGEVCDFRVKLRENFDTCPVENIQARTALNAALDGLESKCGS